MGFTDLKTDSGIAALNDFLSEKSYIEGVCASQADVAVFEAVGSAPNAGKYPHAARWYSHIASFASQFASLAGEKKDASAYGPEAKAPVAAKADDDDVDLFASDEEEDAEAERLKAQRLAEYRAKKAAKGPGPAAKSSVLIDVKPWDNETDLAEMERQVRQIKMEGLLWGGSQLVPIGYGIQKLQINCVVEDDKVGTDQLEEAICGLEDLVQSIDIAAFNKI
jgi:elongation factor 1-beta